MRRLSSFLFVALAVAAASWAVARERRELAVILRSADVSWVVASIGVALLAVFGTYAMWKAVLRSVGVEIGASGPGRRMFFVSQLGKYLPGSVWPVAAQLEFAQRLGLDRRRVMAANLLAISTGLAAGLVLGLPLGLLVVPGAVQQAWWLLAVAPVVLAMGHPRVLLMPVNRMLLGLGREAIDIPANSFGFLVAWAIGIGSWLCFGLHAAALLRALGPLAWNQLPLVLTAVTLSTCAGILALPAPAGAGVRDVLLVAILSTEFDLGVALATALLSRLILTAVDLLAALIGMLGSREARFVKPASERRVAE